MHDVSVSDCFRNCIVVAKHKVEHTEPHPLGPPDCCCRDNVSQLLYCSIVVPNCLAKVTETMTPASAPHTFMNTTSGTVRPVVIGLSHSSSLQKAATTAGQNELWHANECGDPSDALWMIAL